MKRVYLSISVALGLVGCGDMAQRFEGGGQGAASNEAIEPSAASEMPVNADGTPVDPIAETGIGAEALDPATAAPPPPPAARTVETLDTTTPAQREAAAAPAGAAARDLGKTVASLGDPTEPGLWMKTPLVDAEVQGRVTNPRTGKSSAVTLIPLEGPATAGSQLSLAALRLIGAQLTDLTEVAVSVDG